MRTPNAFPELSEAIVQIVTNVVKSFAESIARIRSKCPSHPSLEEIPSGAMEEAMELGRAFDIGWERLVGCDGVKGIGEQLEPVRNLDSLLRDMALSGATHWFAVLVEKFIGACHVGNQFEYEGALYKFHGYRERRLSLVTGQISVKAAYYTREGGGKGLFPLDLVLGADEDGCTREAAFLMAHFSCENDYPQSEELIERATGLRIDQNRLHRKIESLGRTALVIEEEAQEDEEGPEPAERLVVCTDGLMMPMRYDPDGEDAEKAKEGWHEAHVGVVGVPGPAEPKTPKYHRKDRSPERPTKTKADTHRDIELTEQTYLATYEGRNGHLQKLKTEAERRGWTEETETAVLGDGSPWVHENTEPLFPGAQHILDWPHAMEHLAEARDLAYKQGSPDGAAWFARHETNLWEGNPEPVIRSILYLARTSPKGAAKKLRTEAGFFRKRVHIMDYPAYRAAGWPIGSGAVESACRHVAQERCKCSGMRWSTKGLRSILSVRTKIINNRFNELWTAHALESRAKGAA